MPLKIFCSVLVLCLVATSSPLSPKNPLQESGADTKYQTSSAASGPTGDTTKDPIPASEEEPPEGELAPAAVQLDVSNSSPLIQELYKATRETKEKEILSHIDQAKRLVERADLKAVDAQGRTALHWAVFGAR